MGGVACALPRHALLLFDEVPTKKSDLKQFDEQIRQCYANTLIVQGVIEDFGDAIGVEAYKILALDSWTTADRERLLEILEGLYPKED